MVLETGGRTELGILDFFDIPSRYGIDIYRVVYVSASLWFFFTMGIYACFRWQTNGENLKITRSPFPTPQRVLRFRLVEQFFDNQKRPKERLLRPLRDAMSLSGRAFFKLGLGTAYPYRRGLLAWVAYIAWVVGMYMLIHFLFVIKNTLPIALPFLVP